MAPIPQPLSIVAYLAAVVRAHGARPAIFADGAPWSYRELWTRAGEIARWLLNDERFTPTSAVGLIGSNSPQDLAAYLAVLRAGGVVVPLNERLSSEEISRQLDHVRAVGLLAGEMLDDQREVFGSRTPVWPIDECHSDRSARSPAVSIRSTACILLTSGSTGQPKGVVHSHGTMLHASLQLAGALPFSPDNRSLAFLPFYASIPEQILPALLTGGSIDILKRFDTESIARGCRAGATSFDAVPTLVSAVLDDIAVDDLRRLRWMSFASEPMPVPLLERWWDSVPDVPAYQFYGMTECLPITVANPSQLRRRPESVGVPYPTSELTIVDDGLRAVCPGDPGEILCRTPARMVGYLGDPELTKSATTPSGAMRTGDLGRIDEDGALILTGRLKDLIITGGFNVAPGEIEAVACGHPSVAAAVVVGIPDPRWGETPVVVAVPAAGTTLEPSELLGYCRRELAGFKRPSGAALVDRIPMTGIGKSAKGVVRQRILEGGITLVRSH